MRQQLAAGQLGDGQRVSQIQLKENVVAAAESQFGAVGNEVPNSSIGHVDRPKKVGWRMRGCALYSPQERVQVTWL